LEIVIKKINRQKIYIKRNEIIRLKNEVVISEIVFEIVTWMTTSGIPKNP
jgi:hypothetical protein